MLDNPQFAWCLGKSILTIDYLFWEIQHSIPHSLARRLVYYLFWEIQHSLPHSLARRPVWVLFTSFDEKLLKLQYSATESFHYYFSLKNVSIIILYRSLYEWLCKNFRSFYISIWLIIDY